MKTIFITIFQGIEAKNILRTDIYRMLIASPDIRIIFFISSEDKKKFYQKEFPGDRVVYEVALKVRRSFWQKVFSSLKFKIIKTETMDWRRRLALEIHKSRVKYFSGLLLNRLLANRPTRRLIRFLDLRLVRDPSFAPYFEKYNPSIVVSAHPFDDYEASLLREAKKRGVPTVALVNSWDKLTSRCAIRILPDKLVVYNELVKRDALRYADMEEKDIIIAGAPNYDQHINQKKLSRKEFCRKIGADPNKKIILYAPLAARFISSRWSMIDFLQSLIDRGVIKDAQLLVRFQPNDFVEKEEIAKRPDLLCDVPGIRFSEHMPISIGIDWDLRQEEIEHLTNTMHHCDLLISYASSLCVDAAIFDKPVININFELSPPLSAYRSPTELYKMTHYKNALATGAIRLAGTPEELIEWINRYLGNPAIDSEGRKRLVAEQCYKLDGKAGERAARIILGS